MNTLKHLQHYMGRRKTLLPIAMTLSAVSALAGMTPYLLIWLAVDKLLTDAGSVADNGLVAYAWWAAALAVISVALYFAALMASHLAAFRVESNLRREAMQRVVGMPLGFFDTTTSGRIRKIIDDNASITHSFLAHQLPDLAAGIVSPLTAIVFICFFDWRLGLACIIPMLLAAGIMGFMMNTSGQRFMQAYMTALEEMNTEAVEYVRGIPVVKVFQQTIYSFKNFHRSILKYNEMVIRYTRLWQVPMSLYTVIINGFVFFLTPVAILLIDAGEDYLSVLTNFFLYVLLTPVFSEAIMKSMYLEQAVGQAREAIGRMENLLAAKPQPAESKPHDWSRTDIAFSHVSFSYPGATQKAVDDVSFTIPAGQTTALVGASGGGKTTIARLVPRFWEADEGCVAIGGQDVKTIDTHELMQHVSFVFQNTKLFKTTLRENICYGQPHATPSDIDRAISLAQCRDIIDRLPQGLDTRIGAEGTYLSGGEQQRIVLARAILKDAPIVVLDEATAFADPENEHLIQQALKELSRGKTVLTIAHRLSSVVDADNIIVVRQGRIAEQGTHSQLLAKQGIYQHLWNEYQQSVCWSIKKEEPNHA